MSSPSPFGIVFEAMMRHINGESHTDGGGCVHRRCRRYGTDGDETEPEVDPAPGMEACGRLRGHTKFDRVSLMTLVGAGQTDDGSRTSYRRRRAARNRRNA